MLVGKTLLVDCQYNMVVVLTIRFNNDNNVGNDNSNCDDNNEYDKKHNCSLERYFSEALSLSAIMDIHVM